jgi:hypothetical protein
MKNGRDPEIINIICGVGDKVSRSVRRHGMCQTSFPEFRCF